MATTLSTNETVLAAIEFIILTASRSGEARHARWGEIDLKTETWTIPDERMKAGVQHRVPLSSRSIEILSEIGVGEPSALIFGGTKRGNPLSDMTLTMPLRRAELGITIHGFRSSFRDWCGEATNTPNFVAEACLAHTVKNKAEAAYARSDYLEKRRDVMNQWATHCASGATGSFSLPDKKVQA